MNTVLSMIYEIVFDSMHDDALRSIALYTVTNPEEVCTMSVQKLAEACFVSSGSVLKFCQTLGISSFSLFKKCFAPRSKRDECSLPKNIKCCRSKI